MEVNQQVRNQILAFLTITVFWVIIALFLSFVSFLMASQGEVKYSLSVTQSILFEIVCISPWIACSPVIIWLARKYDFGRRHLWMSFAIHCLAALVVFSFHSIVQSSAVFAFFDEPFSWSYVKIDFVGFADMRILLYVGLLLAVHTIEFYKKNKDSILREPRIRAELNKVNFQKILNHLQPDFLIKSIDTIQQDIGDRPKDAEKHLIELGTLLRMMLQNIEKEEVVFTKDMEFLDLYLDLTERRLGIQIERVNNIEPRCYGACIPNFLFIMPFFEELLQHGYCDPDRIERFTNEGWIEDGVLHLDGIIEKVDLTNRDLTRINRKVKMGEIISRLYDRYGDSLELRTFLQDRRIHIYMSLPYRRSEESGHYLFQTVDGDSDER